MSAVLPLALALGVAYLTGRLCARFSIPRVTGYLFAGILLGPSVLARSPDALPGVLRAFALTGEIVASFDRLQALAASMILFAIGLGFRADRLRQLGRSALTLSAVEIALTALLVLALAAAVSVLTGAVSFGLATVLAAVAVATAPAATMLVLRELESEGPTTDHVTVLVGLDNVASLLLFAIAFGSWYLGGPLGSLAKLGIGAAVGVGVGLVLATLLFRMATERTFLVLGLAAILSAAGIAEAVGGDPLLACLLLGATLANASPHADSVEDCLRRVDYPVYVAFFLLAGAELHLDLLLGPHSAGAVSGGTVLLLVGIYVAGRLVGKALSAPIASRIAPGLVRVGGRTGFALLAQAGLAIALVESADRAAAASPALAPTADVLQAVVLAAVAFFELVGPPAVRWAMVHSGEVKIVNLLPDRVREGLAESVVDTLERLRRSLGIPSPGGPKDADEIRAVHIMRRQFTPIRADMRFEEVVHTFASGACDQYPVIDEEGRCLGVISFPEIRSILFEDALAEIVVAADLITGPGVTCDPDTTLPEIIGIFEDCHGEFSHLPVIDRETRKVAGVVDQRSAMVWYRKHA